MKERSHPLIAGLQAELEEAVAYTTGNWPQPRGLVNGLVDGLKRAAIRRYATQHCRVQGQLPSGRHTVSPDGGQPFEVDFGSFSRTKWAEPSDEPEKKRLLYRVVGHNGGVVFAEPDRANHVAQIHAAIRSSRTWGQFEFAMPPEEYEEIVCAVFDENEEPRPENTDPFSSDSVPGLSEGDYPRWLQQEMETFLPRAVLEKYGKRETTSLNGDFWLIPEGNLARTCAALEALGWELEHAEDLEFW